MTITYNMVRRIVCICVFSLCLAGCGQKAGQDNKAGQVAVSYTDALGRTVEFTEQEILDIQSGKTRVAVLDGSFAEIWSIAGGRLAAVTEDACDDTREIAIDADTVLVGNLKNPNLESLLSADAGLVILSADIEGHLALEEKLVNLGIKTVYHSVETFDDYLQVLKLYTELTGQEERYELYGTEVEKEIEGQIARQDGQHPTVLLIRAYSTGVKAKGSDNLTGIMLKDLGCINIADGENGLLEDLSVEAILEKEPDYIFVTTMGDDEAALASVQAMLLDNPAWKNLHAVQNGRYYVLPKNRFHNKPNQRWAESYRMLADILYPENAQ